MNPTHAPDSSTPDVADAIELLGGVSAVAAMLRVRPWAISKWKKNFPPNRALWLAEQTGWRKTPHQLAPSFYPNPLDGIPPEHIRDGEVIAATDDVQPPVGGISKNMKLARASIREGA